MAEDPSSRFKSRSPWRVQAPKSQAERILKKFGGPTRLSELLKLVDPDKPRHWTSIYRWTYPKDKQGTGGIIPNSAMKAVLKAALYDGVVLTPEDLTPDVRHSRDWDGDLAAFTAPVIESIKAPGVYAQNQRKRRATKW